MDIVLINIAVETARFISIYEQEYSFYAYENIF